MTLSEDDADAEEAAVDAAADDEHPANARMSEAAAIFLIVFFIFFSSLSFLEKVPAGYQTKTSPSYS
jgi:hypothetical protein